MVSFIIHIYSLDSLSPDERLVSVWKLQMSALTLK